MNHIKASIASFALTVSFTTSVSQAQTIAAAQELAAEKPMTIIKAHSVTSSNLTLTGNSQGQAILKNTLTDSTVTFQADADKWAREVFLLDGGKTVGASQADHTVFWNVATGQEIGRIPARVYGFSHNQKLCFVWTPDRFLQLYAYPSLQLLGKLNTERQLGIDQFQFSPDDHYLLVKTQRSRPETEDNYPGLHFAFHDMPACDLYDLVTMQAVAEFTRHFVGDMGVFSKDSRFVNLGNVPLDSTDLTRSPNTTWQFDIAAGTLTKTH